MKNLRVQLLVSHLAVVLLMVVVMSGAVYNFMHLGASIDRILRENYDSVIAAENMKETLERQDSAATFLLAGQTAKARQQYEEYRPQFEHWYDVEEHNITERGEKQLADDIGRGFASYRVKIERLLYATPPMPRDQARAYYFGVLEPAFLRIKQRAQDVLDLNQQAMNRKDARARAEARRASWTGVGVTAGALLLALLFAFRMVRSALAPLRSLARQAEEIGAGHLNQRIELRRTDEIGVLAGAFNEMARRLQETWQLEELRLHRAERMSDTALESLYDPVIVTDATAAVIYWNRAAEGLFGPAGPAIGLPIGRAVQDERIVEAVERAIRDECVSAEDDETGLVTVQEPDRQRQRVYRMRASPMHDEDATVLGATAVFEDVTHLRELDRLKSEFIGVASHELRTPVTSLLLSVQLLEEGAAGDLTPDQREVVAAQKEDLLRLERMMRDLLDITRLESGATPPRLESVPPADLVAAAVEAVAAQAEAKGLALDTDIAPDLPRVRADRSQIQRVLLNLLNNAIRHTARGSIQVTVGLRDGSVVFSVRDTGVGIPREYLSRIFDRFVQVPGATRGGAGLGLSIARTIVRAHGGELSAESEPGRGSTFTFTLSVATTFPAPGAAPRGRRSEPVHARAERP